MASMDTKDRENREQEAVVLRVTAHFIEEVQAGHQPVVSDYLACYPEYADAIASFIAYYQTVELPATQSSGRFDFLAATGNRDVTESVDELTEEFHIAVESAWHRVLTSEVTTEQVDVEKIDDMVATGKTGAVEEMIHGQSVQSLFTAAKQKRLSLSQLAAYLDISEDIMMLLDQRAVLPESVPTELYRRLAQTLHQPIRTVQNYAGMERQRQVAEHSEKYDAGDTKDATRLAPKVSFREALDNSVNVSGEQKSSWYDVLTEEGL